MANEDPNGELGVLLNGELHIITGIASVSFKFLQYMLALRRNSRLTESAYTDLKKFQVDTNGEYTIFNIPTQNPEKIEAFKQQLKNAGVAFCELPDLNQRDGIVQLAIRNKDVGKWQYVQDEFLMSQLCGGQFSLKEMSAMTGGRYNIVSVGIGDGTLEITRTADDIQAFVNECMKDERLADHIPDVLKGNPGQGNELLQNALLKDSDQMKPIHELLDHVADTSNHELKQMAEDLKLEISATRENTWMLRDFVRCMDENKVNYAILPDLRYADGKTQFAFVPSDRGRFMQAVRDFETLWARKAESEKGKPLADEEKPHMDVTGMDYEDYRETSEVKMHEYLKNTDPETKAGIDRVVQEHKDKASVKTENFRYALEEDQQAKDPAGADSVQVSVGAEKVQVSAEQRMQKDIPVIGGQARQPVYRVAESGPASEYHIPSEEHVELFKSYAADPSYEQFLLPSDVYRDSKEQYNMCFVNLRDSDQYVAVLSFYPDEHGLRCFIEPDREYGIFRFEHEALKRCGDKIMGAELAAELTRTLAPSLMPDGLIPKGLKP